ncbi:hypothetical protein Tco_1322027 [Tanacetum coccineum]
MRLTINFHHDGTFVPLPLMYQGAESTIRDIEFEGMIVIRLSKLLQGTYLANCIAICFKNGKVIDMFIEHHDYYLSHWTQTEIYDDDEVYDVVDMDDITGYGGSDFVGENDIVIPNRSISDPFLNKKCNGTFINDFSDKSDAGECSQPSGKELDIYSDDEDVDKQFKLVNEVIYLEFDPKLPRNEIKPTLGLKFEHLEQLKECMTNYGVANGYQLWYMRNDYRSLMVLCGRDLAKGRNGGKKVRKGIDLQRKGKLRVSHLLVHMVTKGAHIRSPSKKGVHGESSTNKEKAEGVQGSGLPRNQLLDTNLGSSVHLHVDELDNGKIHFKRIYVCFKAMVEGWSAGCRKVIGLDGCFLKGTCRGELLTTMGRDGNNHMFPIAWVVVNVENNDN